MKNYAVLLNVKGFNSPLDQKFVKAETKEEAEKKADEIIKDYETKDKELEKFINKNGGLEATVTLLDK